VFGFTRTQQDYEDDSGDIVTARFLKVEKRNNSRGRENKEFMRRRTPFFPGKLGKVLFLDLYRRGFDVV
jgi:hypothetical protein